MTLPFFSSATDYSSPTFTVKDPVIDEGSPSATSANFGLGQSVGQMAIGESSSINFKLWSGFQYYWKVNPNVLTATAGDAQVSLSWTVPQVFLGMAVASYEVGIGTTSGSYVFTDVGNITNTVRNGLTNGTPYFFRIKAKGPGGIFLVYSNEATATPTGAIVPPGGGGGGGGGIYSTISFSGLSYPNSTVTIVRDSFIVASPAADDQGNFSVSLTLNPGSYDFSVYGTDRNGNNSPNLNFHENLVGSTTIAREDLLIPPTLVLSATEVKQGDIITGSGFAQANAQVALTTTGPMPQTYRTTAGADGAYSFPIGTGSLSKGNYEAQAQATVSGRTTLGSITVGFKVGDRTVVPPGTCAKRSDLNCDARVNLIDFSILIYFWDSADPWNQRADIDKSGKAGLRDLSIMLYDWTG